LRLVSIALTLNKTLNNPDSLINHTMDNLMKKLTLALCALTLSSPLVLANTPTGDATTPVVGDAQAGKNKSAICAACHGPEGNSNPETPMWPKLAGQHENYIVRQLHAFQAGDRADPSMTPMAAPLSPQDIADLAAYFSSQTRQIGQANPQTLEQGQDIYRGGNKKTGLPACMGCHGPAGSGNPMANYPSLSGQQVDYVKKQLADYKSGARKGQGTVIIMQGVAAKISPEEMQAVADYIAGLH
jgi:cytochrome c553